MSMVERLAKKRAPMNFSRVDENVRWWLNAIAEELEAEGRIRSDPPFFFMPSVAEWLREQAKS